MGPIFPTGSQRDRTLNGGSPERLRYSTSITRAASRCGSMSWVTSIPWPMSSFGARCLSYIRAFTSGATRLDTTRATRLPPRSLRLCATAPTDSPCDLATPRTRSGRPQRSRSSTPFRSRRMRSCARNKSVEPKAAVRAAYAGRQLSGSPSFNIEGVSSQSRLAGRQC
jgi:hypothetical protein